MVEGDLEGFGLVALEAAVMGKTVLVSDLEGIIRVLNNAVAGGLRNVAIFNHAHENIENEIETQFSITPLMSEDKNIQENEDAISFSFWWMDIIKVPKIVKHHNPLTKNKPKISIELITTKGARATMLNSFFIRHKFISQCHKIKFIPV